jgi:hypothetical protein
LADSLYSTQNKLMLIAKNTNAYVVSYLLLMVPTYILPYFGSNSAIVNSLSLAMGMGPTPQWWLHLWCLAMLTLLGWMRGKCIGKGYLAVFPFLAAAFDMTPGFSAIPIVPTIMHLLAIVMGAMGVAAATENDSIEGAGTAKIIAGIVTVVAIAGSIFFATTASRKSHRVEAPAAQMPAPSIKPSSVTPAQRPSATVPQEAPRSEQAAPTPAAPMPEQVQPKAAPAKPPATPVAKQNRHYAPRPTAATKPSEQKAPLQPEVRYIRLND